MFAHNKRLQYTVRVSESNPGLANLMLEQFGGPQGELVGTRAQFLALDATPRRLAGADDDAAHVPAQRDTMRRRVET